MGQVKTGPCTMCTKDLNANITIQKRGETQSEPQNITERSNKVKYEQYKQNQNIIKTPSPNVSTQTRMPDSKEPTWVLSERSNIRNIYIVTHTMY